MSTPQEPFDCGDWVCLNHDHYEVQLALESEWPLPVDQRQLQNFTFGRVLECVEVPDTEDESSEIWCHLEDPVAHDELWLLASWLYRVDRQSVNAVLIESIASVASLLPVSSRISVAGTPFDLKIYTFDPDR